MCEQIFQFFNKSPLFLAVREGMCYSVAMKRIFTLFIILLLLPGLWACGDEVRPASDGNAAESALPGITGPIPAGRSDWAEAYTAFLDENHEALSVTCFGGVAGVGFIDLDLDGTPELVLFDSGASAYMGVQLFDLTEAGVVCVSASSVEAGLTFGDESLSPLYVNALFFDDFRLMESADGRRWFQVSSRNGAEDFYYQELLRFTADDTGRLLPESVWYKHMTIDPATGQETGGVYTVGRESVSDRAFAAAETASASAGEDTGYTAAGVFLWTDKSFDYDRDGLMAMARAAVEAYVPIV